MIGRDDTHMSNLGKTYTSLDKSLPLPTEDTIVSLSSILVRQIQKEEVRKRYAPVKHILGLVGVAGIVGLAVIAPSAAMLAKPFLDEQLRKQRGAWKQYNPSLLRASLRRLHNQKFVEITNDHGEEIVKLTDMGRRRILKYSLNNLAIEHPKRWDGRWRMIIYDVEQGKRRLRDVFRSALKSLGFLKLQESVWIYPYPCENQITFLREYYGVGNEVLYVVATTLEDDSPYKQYFGIA